MNSSLFSSMIILENPEFWGILLLIVLSFYVAKEQKVNPYKAIIVHVGIAVIVIIVSNYFSEWILNLFSSS
jgi:hypothetical protein